MSDIYESREPYYEFTIEVRRLMVEKYMEREPPKTVWLTDTVYCGRKKIYRIIHNVDIPFNDKALNRLWLGLVFERELEALGLATQVPVEYRGIRGRIDVLLDTGEPVEVKTTSNLYVPASEYAKTHIEQLSRYCLAVGKESGVVFYFVPGVKFVDLPAYRYTFDLEKVREVTDERIDLLMKALKLKDPSVLPATWHSNSLENWECRECPFLKFCRQL